MRQIPGEPPRRWFASAFFDLIVWYDSQEKASGFQLCYDKGQHERALTWEEPDRLSHMAVDDGENRCLAYKASPILVADGSLDGAQLARRFRSESHALPQEISGLVLAVLGGERTI